MKKLLHNGLKYICSLFLFLIIGCSETDTVVKEVSDGGTELGNPVKEKIIAGFAHKGPFDAFCTVHIAGLDSDFNQTGMTFSNTTDSAGSFEIPTQLTSDFAELSISGFYFDEISYNGETSSYIDSGSLRIGAIVNVSNNNNININVLTTIAKDSILRRIDSGMTFDQAYVQTCYDVLQAFNITDDTQTLFEDMVMLEEPGTISPEGNKILLAVSAIIMQMAHNSCGASCTDALISKAVKDIMGYISEDIEDNGILDNPDMRIQIDNAITSLEHENIRNYMKESFPDYQIPAFEEYITGNLNLDWSVIDDCSVLGISSIGAEIHNPVNGNITTSILPCPDKEGMVTGLNAGAYDTILFTFYDSNDDPLLTCDRGEVTPIIARQTTSIDPTQCYVLTGYVSGRNWNIDCEQTGISTIEATLFDSSDNEIQSAGPWDCGSNDEFFVGNIFDEVIDGKLVMTYRDQNSIILGMSELTGMDVPSEIGTYIDDLTIILPVITQPLTSSTYREGDIVSFEGSGFDFEGNPLSGSDLVWISDINGQIGTGVSFDINTLTTGLHTITLTAVDSSLGSLSTSITLHVRLPLGTTIYVGPGEVFATIQSAINGADPGDKIIVKDGIYTENVTVDKELIIESENGYTSTTIIAADPTQPALEIQSDNVVLDGFTLYGTTESNTTGISLNNQTDCVIKNNRCGINETDNNYLGIHIQYGTNIQVIDNICNANDTGIHMLYSDNNTISGNVCASNVFRGISLFDGDNNSVINNDCNANRFGIYLDSTEENNISGNNVQNTGMHGIYFTTSNLNTITDNICNDNRYGITFTNTSNDNLIQNNTCISNYQYGIRITEDSSTNTVSDNTCNSSTVGHGIRLSYTTGNFVQDNTCTLNPITGIYLIETSSTTISGNTCSENGNGMMITQFSNNNTISNNDITLNSSCGLRCSSSTGNTIYLNNINNSFNIDSPSLNINTWYSPTEITYTYNGSDYTGYLGNFYSDHDLTDTSGNGITDDPYDLPGDEPDDVYPLVDTPDNYE